MEKKEPPYYNKYLEDHYGAKEKISLFETIKHFLYGSKFSLAFIVIITAIFFITKIIEIISPMIIVGILFVVYSMLIGQKMEDETYLRHHRALVRTSYHRKEDDHDNNFERERYMLIGETSLAWAIKGALMLLVSFIILLFYF